MNKTCTSCDVMKSADFFYKDLSKKDGLRSHCKSCSRQKDKAKRAKRNRFEESLRVSRKKSESRSIMPCIATVKELGIAFTGKCHICEVPEVECNQKLHMDHDHETGKFRGWLCYHCNNMLGRAKDSEEILVNALHYLMNCKEPARRE